jgi:hypothetical protein
LSYSADSPPRFVWHLSPVLSLPLSSDTVAIASPFLIAFDRIIQICKGK